VDNRTVILENQDPHELNLQNRLKAETEMRMPNVLFGCRENAGKRGRGRGAHDSTRYREIKHAGARANEVKSERPREREIKRTLSRIK
jgi:hypothetical protein